MNVDEIYDRLLEHELGAPATTAPVPNGAAARVHAARTDPGTAGADLEAGSMEPGPPGADAAGAGESSRVTGFGRYRNAALVGAGGLACAAVGAFLGGLGGYFSVAPAAAHVVGATTQDTPLADAVNGAASHPGLAGHGSGVSGVATLAEVEGSLTNGISTFSLLGADPSSQAGAGGQGSAAGIGGSGSGGSGAAGTGCASGGVDLTSLIDSVTCTLGNIGSLPGSGASGLPPSLSAVVGDMTGTLSSLGGLPGSLPTASGLPFAGGSAASGSLAGALNAVTEAADGVTKGGASSLPLPTSGGSGSSTPPVTTPALPSVPGAPTISSNGGSTTASVPVPSVPVPVGTTITIGGVSVGVNTGGSSPGATLNLP
jgi:hypothetical protein